MSWRGRFPPIVIERDGKTIVITAWRAWLIGTVVVVLMMAVLAVLDFLVLGFAVSVVASRFC
jgi:hypothetical protein